jgi:hypothetical protein
VKPGPSAPEGAERLSLAEVEDSALETLVQKGVQMRLYFAPFVFLAVMSLLAWDPAP